MKAGRGNAGTRRVRQAGGGFRPGRSLPAWPSVLAVIAHPDDESFGLGGIVDRLAGRGAAVHILCYTRGEASTLNETGADLHQVRETELREAGPRQRAAALLHATQISPTAVLWRRLQLLGDCEHLRWPLPGDSPVPMGEGEPGGYPAARYAKPA